MGAESRVDELLGSWSLESVTADLSDGTSFLPYGAHPQGLLAYLADGNMVAVITDPAMPRFASDAVADMDAEEAYRALRGSVAYFGRYEMADEVTVVHHVAASVFPNWVGRDQVRYLDLNGDRLTITTPPTPTSRGRDVTFTLVWRRSS